MQDRGIVAGVSPRVRMVDRLGALEGGGHACDRRVDMTEYPESPRHERQPSHAGVLAGGPRSLPIGLAARVERLDSTFADMTGLDGAPHEEENHGLPAHRIQQGRPVAARFGEFQQSRDRSPGLWQLAPYDTRGGQPEHDLEILGRISKALA